MKKPGLLNNNESNYKSNYRYNIILIDPLYIIDSNLTHNIVNQHPERIPSFFNDLGTYFVHQVYCEGRASRFMHIFSSILSRLDMKSLMRIKVNLYPRTPTLEVHAAHTDYDYPHTGAVFYLNTNNGNTILEDGTRIASIANRVLLFDASTPHSSTSTTDSKARFNININYE